MKIATIVGARPQFIKAAALSRAITNDYSGRMEEFLIHTGQHYDDNMSKVFFDELSIPSPKYNLEISGGTHGKMTGRMLEAIEAVLLSEKPDYVLIYGDTNSTLAGAVAAVKLHIPLAHVEAGLRSFNMRMPEEVNRILSDRVSNLLFCPTVTAVHNLANEGITQGVHMVGDVMYDAALFTKERASKESDILTELGLKPKGFVLSTCHRAENTDDQSRLSALLEGLAAVSEKMPVVLPLHPRTRNIIESQPRMRELASRLTILEPISFLNMVKLECNAAVVATDSGGVQKEAFFYGVPCVTLRDETEWVETVESGWNRLAPPGKSDIAAAVLGAVDAIPGSKPDCYGNGRASHEIIDILLA